MVLQELGSKLTAALRTLQNTTVSAYVAVREGDDTLLGGGH